MDLPGTKKGTKYKRFIFLHFLLLGNVVNPLTQGVH